MADTFDADKIRAALTKTWRDVSGHSACNLFLQNVAKEFGIKDLNDDLDGLADTQINNIIAHWELIPSPALAAAAAQKGAFVVAVLRGLEHADHRRDGHVAIVLPGPLQQRGSGDTGGSYPLVWCAGGKGGQSDGTRTVGDVWRPVDRNNVKYYQYKPK